MDIYDKGISREKREALQKPQKPDRFCLIH